MQPNVVLIVCDDLNDFITGMGGHPQARTPNLARLAESGVAFRHAYCNNQICAPSRSSFLTGIYPHKSGNLFFDPWFKNPVLSGAKTLMEYFRENGYHVAGSGKLMHHHKPEIWCEYGHRPDYGPFAFDGQERAAHPAVPKPFADIGPVDGSFGPLEEVPFAGDDTPGAGWVYGYPWGENAPLRYVNDDNRDPTPDERNARWAADRIRQFAVEDEGAPFFLGVGFIRPHTPLHVPQRYFDMFPLEDLELAEILPGDVEDCHFAEVMHPNQKGPRYFRTLGDSYPDTEAGLKAFTQAYLACIAAVDDCIGQVIDAIDASPFRDNTIIVFTSDNGWQMGQKDYLFKNSPWEESTRVPLIVRAPGVAAAGTVAEDPVSLIDLYPTLVDLCGLRGETRKNSRGLPLDGHSLRPLLEDPEDGEWNGPAGALSMVYIGLSKREYSEEERRELDKQHWTIRTRRWRYIRYNNGAEELYDHDADPREWTNLAEDPERAAVMAAFRDELAERVGPL